jgi:hypothetical protein
LSARDRAFVWKHVFQEQEIEKYFADKGKRVPAWVKRLGDRYMQFQPDYRFPAVLARFWRGQIVGGLDKPNIRDLFTRAVALYDLIDVLDYRGQEADQTRSKANLLMVKLLDYSKDLERQYKVDVHFDFTSPVKALEPWERELPN